MKRTILFWAGFLLYSFLIGVIGLSLLFSDLGPGESGISRAFTIGIVYLISSLPIGYVLPKHWKRAGYLSWSSLLLFFFAFLGSLPEGLQRTLSTLTLLTPLFVTLLGGYIGSYLRTHYKKV